MTMFQTRREDGTLRFFGSLKEALEDAKDMSVWKISFSVGDEHIRLVREVLYSDTAFTLRMMHDELIDQTHKDYMELR